MRRSRALELLDPTHARALRLAEAGVGIEDIAAQLTLDPSAVGPVLVIARAKLAALEARPDGDPTATSSPDSSPHPNEPRSQP